MFEILKPFWLLLCNSHLLELHSDLPVQFQVFLADFLYSDCIALMIKILCRVVYSIRTFFELLLTNKDVFLPLCAGQKFERPIDRVITHPPRADECEELALIEVIKALSGNQANLEICEVQETSQLGTWKPVCLTNWLTDWPKWLTHSLIDRLTDWLIQWLTDWLSDWLTDGLTDWGTDWLASLTDWRLIEWLCWLNMTDHSQLIGWLTDSDSLTHSLTNRHKIDRATCLWSADWSTDR